MYISHAHRILFMPVPKSGCTTVKKLLWFMESGYCVQGNIHNANPTTLIDEIRLVVDDHHLDGYFKFCVVRDPVERLISAYNHRVLVEDEIKRSVFLANRPEINLEPSFEEFATKLDVYMRDPVIEHHVRPMYHFLGDNPKFYVRIYKLKEINTELIPLLEEACGHSLKMDMSVNASPHVVKKSDLSNELILKIKKFYKKDYELYGKYL